MAVPDNFADLEPDFIQLAADGNLGGDRLEKRLKAVLFDLHRFCFGPERLVG